MMIKQLYKWVRERQYAFDYGLLQTDEIFDPGERGIHLDIIANWERDGWCEKVKPEKKKSTKKVRANGRYRKKTE